VSQSFLIAPATQGEQNFSRKPWHCSATYQQNRVIGNKYATFHFVAFVEGVAR